MEKKTRLVTLAVALVLVVGSLLPAVAWGSRLLDVQWNELYHNAPGYDPLSEFVPDESYTFRDVHPSGQVYDDTTVRITMMCDRTDLTSANVRYWTSGEGWAAMNWKKNWTGAFHGVASNEYDVYEGWVPAQSTGATVWYRIQLNDGADTDWLFASGGDWQNPLGQWVADNATGNDWSYTVADDDTTGPQYADVSWDGSHVYARVYDGDTVSGDDDSGVYDDGTGSGGQGMYLKWDATKATVDGGGGTEVQMSQYSGDVYRSDSTFGSGQFYFRIYAHNDDSDNGLTTDREQSNSGTRSSVPGSGASQNNDVWWNEVYHDTRSAYYRAPFGAVPTGQAVTIRVRAAANDLSNATLVVYNAEGGTQWLVENTPESTDGTYDYYQFTVPAQTTSRILYYKFRLTDGSDCDWYVDDHAHNAYDHEDRYENGAGMMVTGKSGDPCSDSAAGYGDNSFNITVYDSAFTTPDWWKNAVVYQIMPDRFRNGNTGNDPQGTDPDVYGTAVHPHTTWNEAPDDPRDLGGGYYQKWSADFFGGDLQGIIDKLAYLQGQGITAIYLNPVFQAPSNHGYDTTDYLNIDPYFGNNALFGTLNTQAESRGIKLILDGVFNHTGSDSTYFDKYGRYATVGAYENVGSAYYSWYTFNTWPNDYVSWWGYDSLPLLNENNAVKDYVFDANDDDATPSAVVQYWYYQGADGWRFDVADEVSHTWWHEFRAQVKDNDGLTGPLISEVWYEAQPWLMGDQLDATMNYRFRKAVLGFLIDSDWTDNDNHDDQTMWALTPSQFDYALNSIREDYPAPAWYAMMNLLGSHDTNRPLFVLDERSSSLSNAIDKLELAALLQFTMPGAPTIYYGDEVGLGAADYGGYGAWGAGKTVDSITQDDPYNRHPYPWTDETGVLPGGLPNTDLRDTYAALAQIRSDYACLSTGDLSTVKADDANQVYAYARWDAGNTAIVVLNRKTAAQAITLDVGDYFNDGDVLTDRLEGAKTYNVSGGQVTIPLADTAALHGHILVGSTPTGWTESFTAGTAVFHPAGARGVTIDFPTNADAPDAGCSVTVAVYVGETPPSGVTAIERWYEITSNCADFSADVTFTYQDSELNGNSEGLLKAYRWNGSAWEEHTVNAGDRDPIGNKITVRGVTGFSRWSLSSGTPTAVGLTTVAAAAPAPGAGPLSLVLAVVALGAALPLGVWFLRRRRQPKLPPARS